MIGLTFNGKHSYNDFGLILNYFRPQPPAPKKILASVPFMNGDGYDFSTLGSNGEIVYSGRDIDSMFTILGNNEADLYLQYSNVLEWLLNSGKVNLIHDSMIDVYFIAEVRDPPTLNKENSIGELQVKFRADPIKIGVNLVNIDIPWDTFNFEQDYLEDTQFTIAGSQDVTIYNPGRSVSPVINASAAMTATINGYTTDLLVGDNADYGFRLKPGANSIAVNGTGTISFIFRKRVL